MKQGPASQTRTLTWGGTKLFLLPFSTSIKKEKSNALGSCSCSSHGSSHRVESVAKLHLATQGVVEWVEAQTGCSNNDDDGLCYPFCSQETIHPSIELSSYSIIDPWPIVPPHV